jgi:diguanylate cyclase (GGDEF)-like protein/PAS domain S-box-containing protein
VGASLESVEFYRSVLESIDSGVYFVDPNRNILHWNAGAERITGYSREEVVGHCCADNLLMHCDANGRMLCLAGCPLSGTIRDGKSRKALVFLKHKKGYRVPVEVRVSPVFGVDGEVLGAIEVFGDVAAGVAAVQQARELKNAAFVDSLTEICNRRSTEERLAEATRYCEEVRQRTAVVFVDIDRFKSVNDTWSHEVGDAVLRMVAETMLNSLRSYDYIGRWGGDEFVIILSNVDEDRAREVCERCRALVERSHVSRDGQRIQVTCSVGFAMFRPGDDPESIMRRADAKMYASKRAGGNRVNPDAG